MGIIYRKTLLDDRHSHLNERDSYLNSKEQRLNEWEANLTARETDLALHLAQQVALKVDIEAVKQEVGASVEVKQEESNGGEGKKSHAKKEAIVKQEEGMKLRSGAKKEMVVKVCLVNFHSQCN